MKNTKNTKKKIAVITGSSEGITKAIVIALANSGQCSGIAPNSRKVERAQQVADQVESLVMTQLQSQ